MCSRYEKLWKNYLFIGNKKKYYSINYSLFSCLVCFLINAGFQDVTFNGGATFCYKCSARIAAFIRKYGV